MIDNTTPPEIDLSKLPEGFTIYDPERLRDISGELEEWVSGMVHNCFYENVFPDEEEAEKALAYINRRMTEAGEESYCRLAQRLYKDLVRGAAKGLERFRKKQIKGKLAAEKRFSK